METLVQTYINLATSHGEFMLNGDSENGNRIHSQLMKVIAQLKLDRQHVRHEFFATLNHPNDSVKLWTATTLLKTIENEAVKVLRHIAKNNSSIHRVTANATIECWKKGMLTDITDWNE